MTQVSTDDVRQLATLSGLTPSDNEVDTLRDDLSNILSYIDKLATLDTEGVEPTYQVNGQTNVYRKDEVEQADVTGADLVQMSPEHTETQIKVPKVL